MACCTTFPKWKTGLACSCTCPDPACAKPLIAHNQRSPTRKRAPYFAHASQTPGCGERESALHRLGKEMVERATQLVLPAWSALDGELSFATAPATLAPGSAEPRACDPRRGRSAQRLRKLPRQAQSLEVEPPADRWRTSAGVCLPARRGRPGCEFRARQLKCSFVIECLPLRKLRI